MPPDASKPPACPAKPIELEHAERHIVAAALEWNSGNLELCRMHLREAIADAAWALYAATVVAASSS